MNTLAAPTMIPTAPATPVQATPPEIPATISPAALEAAAEVLTQYQF